MTKEREMMTFILFNLFVPTLQHQASAPAFVHSSNVFSPILLQNFIFFPQGNHRSSQTCLFFTKFLEQDKESKALSANTEPLMVNLKDLTRESQHQCHQQQRQLIVPADDTADGTRELTG
jgi:hypothetical protein